jgi:hypothetical protein
MKALVSAFALLAFVASTSLPIQSYAQTAGTEQTMAPETSTSTAPATTTTPKKKHSSKSSHHAKKKSKKSTTAQTGSARHKHASHSVS